MPEKKNVRQQEKTQQKEAVIYLGPPIAGVAMQGVVYNNGLPTKLKDAVKELPALEMLLVEIPKVEQARKDLKKKDSAVSICYRKAEEYFKKGRKV